MSRFAFCIALLIAIVVPSEHAPAATNRPEITEIHLERTPCFGTCEADRVVFRKDGTCDYYGTRMVERLGHWQGRVSEEDYRRMADLVRKTRFFTLKDSYTRPVTDHPSILTTVRMGRRTKQVNNYADAGPARLWQLERTILGVTWGIEWRPEETP